MNIASALIKRVLEDSDLDTWTNVRKHYLPTEYQTLYSVIEKHCETHHALPSFEELKLGIRDGQTRAKLYAVEAIEVDADPSLLLEFLKNEYAQREILNKLENYIDNSIAFESAEESLSHLHQIVLDVEEQVEIKDPEESMEKITLFESDEELSRYITLGLNREYDEYIKFSPRDLILIGGRRGAGKSVTCANLAVNTKNSGKASLYFTIEMDSRNILQRCCSIDTQIPFGKIRTKNLSIEEWEVIAQWWADRKEHGDYHYQEYLKHRDFGKLHTSLVRERLKPNQIQIIYDPKLTIGKIQSEIDKMYKNHDLGIIIVDYVNQVRRGISSKNGQYDWTEQIEIAKALKSAAQEYEVPVISPYQIDAGGEARFAKGILDSADAAYIMNTWSPDDKCITFECVKMRNNEIKTFTSEVDWPSLKIGPATSLTPKERAQLEKKSSESIDEEVF